MRHTPLALATLTVLSAVTPHAEARPAPTPPVLYVHVTPERASDSSAFRLIPAESPADTLQVSRGAIIRLNRAGDGVTFIAASGHRLRVEVTDSVSTPVTTPRVEMTAPFVSVRWTAMGADVHARAEQSPTR